MIQLIDISLEKKIVADLKKHVGRVIDSNKYILGPELDKFEKQFAKSIGSKGAIGTGSGTDALRLALRSLGVGRGDKVLTVAFTSPFTSIAILEEGAIPVYCDVDEKTWTIDVNDCGRKIDKKVKAIMPVHIYGNPANMNAIIKLAKRFNLKVIEDACQAFMATVSGKNVGTLGDAAAFSFYPTKNLGGMGDGGMLTSNKPKVTEMARLLRHGGQTNRFWHELQGTNSRLDEIQAIILSRKLMHSRKFNNKRAKLAKRYKKLLRETPVTVQQTLENSDSANHLFVIKAPKREKLKTYLLTKGIESDIYYPYGLHQMPAFSKYSKSAKLKVTESLLKEVLAIPLHPNLTPENQEYVTSSIKAFYKNV